jgi:hypothetical protein
MTPEQASERARLLADITALITRLGDGSRDDAARDALLLEVAGYQARFCSPYGRFFAQRTRVSGPPKLVHDVPALPTDGFRFARISSRAPDDDVRVFESSGTTRSERSRHAFADLSLYDLAARAAARYALFPDLERITLLILAPRAQELQSSSLSYMLERFVDWFGSEHCRWLWPLDASALDAALREAESRGAPVALLGTSFAFVHALDALAGARYALPRGRRLMQTGGFKGRSREVPRPGLYAAIERRLGVAVDWCVNEYGMTEMSSQFYDGVAGRAGPVEARRYRGPGWVRTRAYDPETLEPVPDGAVGVLRHWDLANVDSVMALQTADLGRVLPGGGFELLGRARGAEARGCSIAMDELLSALAARGIPPAPGGRP